MDYFPKHLNRRTYRVVVPHGVQKQLAGMFRVSKQKVSDVLRQKHLGERSRDIIAKALELGGYWESTHLSCSKERIFNSKE